MSKYRFYVLILILILPTITIAQKSVIDKGFLTTQQTGNVFMIKTSPDIRGTCFLIQYKNAKYLVTAKHLFPNKVNGSEVNYELSKQITWEKHKNNVFFHPDSLIDIAVLPIVSQTFTGIHLAGAKFILGIDAYFLGYPYGYKIASNFHDYYSSPLVKKAIISGIVEISDSINVILLDGHNNPGFSGGPVFYKDITKQKDLNWYLLGVISSYVFEPKILQKSDNTELKDYAIFENSGIIIIHGSKYIKYIIDYNNL